uniref:Uncharacterized protein n=1 Tax=Anguilla anguilla TaxID=7936 RepID=A0A0E9V4A3_ANGAN
MSDVHIVWFSVEGTTMIYKSLICLNQSEEFAPHYKTQWCLHLN